AVGPGREERHQLPRFATKARYHRFALDRDVLIAQHPHPNGEVTALVRHGKGLARQLIDRVDVRRSRAGDQLDDLGGIGTGEPVAVGADDVVLTGPSLGAALAVDAEVRAAATGWA